LLNNIHKSSLIKGAIFTVGLSGGRGKIKTLSLKKLSEGALAPLAPPPTITALKSEINLIY
jgi:hypothetical protein